MWRKSEPAKSRAEGQKLELSGGRSEVSDLRSEVRKERQLPDHKGLIAGVARARPESGFWRRAESRFGLA